MRLHVRPPRWTAQSGEAETVPGYLLPRHVPVCGAVAKILGSGATAAWGGRPEKDLPQDTGLLLCGSRSLMQ